MKSFSDEKILKIMYHYKLSFDEVLDKDLTFLYHALNIINEEQMNYIQKTRIGVACGIGDALSSKTTSYKKIIEDILL